MSLVRTGIFAISIAVALATTAFEARAATTVDADFVAAAEQSHENEMSLARLELARGSSDEARSYAQRMLEDHAPLEAALAALAPNARANAAPPAADRLVRERLERSSGVAFDQTYLLTMVAGHLSAVNTFETEVSDGSDARLRAYARAALPTLREHLSVAMTATKHIGGHSPLKDPQ